LNNKLIPYIQDLWLFLIWFYRIKWQWWETFYQFFGQSSWHLPEIKL
jgi:hypothetical protein